MRVRGEEVPDRKGARVRGKEVPDCRGAKVVTNPRCPAVPEQGCKTASFFFLYRGSEFVGGDENCRRCCFRIQWPSQRSPLCGVF